MGMNLRVKKAVNHGLIWPFQTHAKVLVLGPFSWYFYFIPRVHYKPLSK